MFKRFVVTIALQRDGLLHPYQAIITRCRMGLDKLISLAKQITVVANAKPRVDQLYYGGKVCEVRLVWSFNQMVSLIIYVEGNPKHLEELVEALTNYLGQLG